MDRVTLRRRTSGRVFSILATIGLVAGMLAVMPMQSAVAAAPLCKNKPATIWGTSGRDILIGTAGVDVFAGKGGADSIIGLGGDDLICGGGGPDIIDGMDGMDTVYGGAGSDVCYAPTAAEHLLHHGCEVHADPASPSGSPPPSQTTATVQAGTSAPSASDVLALPAGLTVATRSTCRNTYGAIDISVSVANATGYSRVYFRSWTSAYNGALAEWDQYSPGSWYYGDLGSSGGGAWTIESDVERFNTYEVATEVYFYNNGTYTSLGYYIYQQNYDGYTWLTATPHPNPVNVQFCQV